MSSLFGQKTICIVTGASRGIGKEIAIQFSKHVGQNSLFCLTARDSNKLEETTSAVQEAAGTLGTKIRTLSHSLDLESADDAKIDSLLDVIAIGDERFDVLLVIHNAGSLICDKLASQLENSAEIDSYFHMNFSSAVVLTSKCFTRLGKSINNAIAFVNISSLCGIKPFRGSSLYCAVKAARNIYFASLAAECEANSIPFNANLGQQSDSATTSSQLQHKPVVRVLNYAPGPVMTDMARKYCEETADVLFRDTWEERIPKLLTCEQTVTKLIRLMVANAFESGTHIDYFDDEPTK